MIDQNKILNQIELAFAYYKFILKKQSSLKEFASVILNYRILFYDLTSLEDILNQLN